MLLLLCFDRYKSKTGGQGIRSEAVPRRLLQVSPVSEGRLQSDALPVHLRVQPRDWYLHPSNSRDHQLQSSFAEEILLPVRPGHRDVGMGSSSIQTQESLIPNTHFLGNGYFFIALAEYLFQIRFREFSRILEN